MSMTPPPSAELFPCGCLITSILGDEADRRIIYANRYLYALLGCDNGSLENRPLSGLLTPASRILFESFILPMLKHQGYCEEILLEIQSPSGKKIPVVTNASVDYGNPDRTLWSMFSAIQRDKLEQELVEMKRIMEDKAERFESLSTIDELTGLINRRKLDEHASLMLAHARRSREPIAMLLIDIDHFKSINDNLGHSEGDLILKQLGKLFRDYGRESDVIGRYGGEEFLVLLPGAGKSQARQAAKRYHKAACQIEAMNRPLTVSIGGSFAQGYPELSYGELFEVADTALYRAKASGRNQTCVLQVSTDSSNA